MNTIKKRKIKKFFQKYKGWLIGGSAFIILGLTALLLGFEIANDWQFIRKWLSSPYATTFFICIGLGGLALLGIVFIFCALRKGDEE